MAEGALTSSGGTGEVGRRTARPVSTVSRPGVSGRGLLSVTQSRSVVGSLCGVAAVNGQRGADDEAGGGAA